MEDRSQKKPPFDTGELTQIYEIREDECPIISEKPEMEEPEKSTLEDERPTEIHKISEDEFPIIFYEPDIESPDKRILKEMIQGNNSIIFVSDPEKFLQVIISLSRSFDLICSREVNEKRLSKIFQDIGYAHNRRLLDYEEKSFLQHLFTDISDSIRKSLKVYSFFTESYLMREDPFCHFDAFIERLAYLKDKYGDQLPVILFEPNIDTEEKKTLKEFIQGNNSIHFFSEFEEAMNFVRSLGISFILIFSKEYNEQILLQGFKCLDCAYSRRMLDFEEEALFKEVFTDSSNLIKNSLRAYSFVTLLDLNIELLTKTPVKEDEKDVMVMCELKEITKEFRKEFTVVWYDPKISLEAKKILLELFDIEEANIYNDFGELFQKIYHWNGPPYHLILTGKDESNTIIDEIKDFEDLLGVYIYCDDSELEKRKNRQVVIRKNLNELIPKIIEGIRTKSKLKDTFPAFATDFDAVDKSHIYNLHHYLKGLINFNNRRQAKHDFISLAKTVYQSKKIFEFEQEYDGYKKKEILKWYTIESPVYKLINNCLRIATSDSILYCRYILKDLEQAIKEQYQETNDRYNGLVYRGAYISKGEWEKLQINVGKEIEMYGFLSTSQSLEKAKSFMERDPENKILITIIIPPFPLPELDEQGFADLSKVTQFSNEEEILFNVRSKFKILATEILKPSDQGGQEYRHLVLLYGAQLLRKYMTHCQPTIEVKLKLLADIFKCQICNSKENLFGFKEENPQLLCLNCLRKISVPKNIPIIALEEKDRDENRTIIKTFQGKFLKFNKTFNFSYSGYKCQNCNRTGKIKYYKWIAKNGKDFQEQCSECFEKNIKVNNNAGILISEENPYTLWQEHQAESEKIESDYQIQESKEGKIFDQGRVYVEVQLFDLSLKYRQKVISKLKMKRWREREKIQTLEGLGEVLEATGKHQQAEKYFIQVLDLNTKIYGEENLFSVSSTTNLALMFEKLGQHQQALRYYEKALHLTKKIYGEIHPETARLYNNLSAVFGNIAEYKKALHCCKKALVILKALYGEKHLNTASVYNNMGSVYDRLGNYPEALRSYEEALNIQEAIVGEIHSINAISYSNMGMALQSLGEYQKALEYYEKALNITKAKHGENHSQTAGLYGNIASVQKHFGNYQKALEYFKKAMKICEIIYEKEHEDTATSYNNVGSVYSCLGQFETAFEYFMKALNIFKVVYGEHHPTVAASYNNLGAAYADLRDYPKALEYHEKALQIRKATFGEEHPETANSYTNLGSTFSHLRQYQRAAESYKKALDINKAIYEEKHPMIVLSYRHLGLILFHLGEYQKAFESFKKILDIKKSLYGEYHPDVAELYDNLAGILQRSGEREKGLEYHMQAMNIRKIIYG